MPFHFHLSVVQAYLVKVVGFVLGHCSKANTVIKQVTNFLLS